MKMDQIFIGNINKCIKCGIEESKSGFNDGLLLEMGGSQTIQREAEIYKENAFLLRLQDGRYMSI